MPERGRHSGTTEPNSVTECGKAGQSSTAQPDIMPDCSIAATRCVGSFIGMSPAQLRAKIVEEAEKTLSSVP